MKIKRLNLCNIASIETAEIDFEHDLIDPSTGTNANIFLITGDTGVGKTALLDGISLALYKTTPRLAKVVNPKENNFENRQGETISINSLNQYIRLGISPSEKCYSEVFFVGNDGIDYIARLDLGYTRNGTYRDPEWKVKIGDNDWEKVDHRDNQIQRAVGLSFEQFNRMAMLAQGQFADFLCGDKKERETILEQLTNTERFSTYGIAIKNLFTKANENKKIAETALDTEKAHILSNDEVKDLTQKIVTRNRTIADLQQQISLVENQIEQVSHIIDNEKKAQQAKQRIADYQSIQAGQEYKSHLQLTVDLPNTEHERQQLLLLRKTIQEKNTTETQLKACQQTFGILTSDLNWRKEQLAHDAELLEQKSQWLKEHADRDSLYTQANETLLLLDNYASRESKCQQLTADLTTSQSTTSTLKARQAQADTTFKQADQAVKAKEQAIQQILQQRDALQPDNIVQQLSLLADRKRHFEDWNKRHLQLVEKKQSIDTALKEIDNDRSRLNDLKQTYLAAKHDTEQAKSRSDEAMKRYSTMNSSASDTLKTLRARMAEIHADTCPLCGQHIALMPVDDDLMQMLAPLKDEQQQRALEYNQALEKQNQAQQEHDKLTGQLLAKEEGIATQKRAAAQEEETLRLETAKEGCTYDDTFTQRALAILQATEQQISTYEQQHNQVKSLNLQWQQLLNEKKPLDAAFNTAQQELLNANHALNINAEKINTLSQQIADERAEQQRLANTLTQRLSTFYPDWQLQLSETRLALNTSASEYLKRKNEHNTSAQQFERSQELYQQLSGLHDALLLNHPQWNLNYQPQQHLSANILSKWNTLTTSVTTIQSRQLMLDDTISQCRATLDNWYRLTQHDEQYLNNLINKASLLTKAQQFVKQTDESLHSAKDALAEANKSITDSRNKLGLQATDNIPDIDERKNYKAQLLTQKEQESAAIATDQNRLDTNTENQKRLTVAEQEVEARRKDFSLWDKLNRHFGGTRFRTLVQNYILRPLLINANIYLEQITDRYLLTCNEENEKLTILVLDRYNKNEIRSATVLSGGERFMVSLALSLALSSLNRPDLNVNILFIDEGFGTLDQKSLDSVMSTLEKLQDIAGQSNRRVGIISHREELNERIRNQIRVRLHGEGRSRVEIVNE